MLNKIQTPLRAEIENILRGNALPMLPHEIYDASELAESVADVSKTLFAMEIADLVVREGKAGFRLNTGVSYEDESPIYTVPAAPKVQDLKLKEALLTRLCAWVSTDVAIVLQDIRNDLVSIH